MEEGIGDGGGGELSTLEFENSQLHIKATPVVIMVVRTIGTPPAKIDSIIERVADTDGALAVLDDAGAVVGEIDRSIIMKAMNSNG